MGILRHVKAATKVGHKFMLMLNWAQKSVGVQKPLLEDTTNLPHLEGKWLKQVRQDMTTAEYKITLPNAWKPEPLQVGDRCIMDVFRKSGLFISSQLASLHRSCLHFQVTWLSEIVSSDCTNVIDQYFKATASLQNLDGDKWPQQPPPNKKNCNLWNKALIDIVCYYSRQLYAPLGEWIKDNHTWRVHFELLKMK
eukprot:13205691-Ditylum_brightwellii.AAC.1